MRMCIICTTHCMTIIYLTWGEKLFRSSSAPSHVRSSVRKSNNKSCFVLKKENPIKHMISLSLIRTRTSTTLYRPLFTRCTNACMVDGIKNFTIFHITAVKKFHFICIKARTESKTDSSVLLTRRSLR